ncbi:MAG: glutathione ABC transporter permease GsiC [Candidatus Rokubacteria bacterium RIFCSPLOWO2_02_FULL_68_19]|nr:MAG: glutathione ABC transporter permease GsiC [Candidatus Rokubacteria bacterium RIFCSPLOWO2_02_FULL_68_19]
MVRYALKRLLLVVPTLFLVSLFVFAIVRAIPGDVVDMMLEQFQYGKDAAELRQKLGLDRPLAEQYLVWVGGVLRGNLGQSLWTKRPALVDIAARFPVTLTLSLLSIVISLLVALPVGILAAVKQDTSGDYAARSFAIGALSIPNFWLATLIVVIPSFYFQWAPSIGNFVGFREDPGGYVAQLVLPAICLGITQAGVIMRMTRGMMLEVLRQDYVRTAWAKGLAGQGVVLRHALRNAMIPIVTVIGGQMPFYVGGSIVMEHIFGLPGMGSFVLEAISRRDYPVIQAVNLFVALLVILSNLLVDLSYGALDPRLRHE